jgi:hypothetical protein
MNVIDLESQMHNVVSICSPVDVSLVRMFNGESLEVGDGRFWE